jgi:hypothetical protein
MAVALLGAAGLAHAGLSFQMEVATHNESGAKASRAPADQIRTSQVVLGAQYMTVTTGESTTIWDFAKRRRFLVDLKAGTYVDYSLFDTIGFRVMESHNRVYLSSVLAAAKAGQSVLDPVFDEQSMSVLLQKPRTLEERVDGADIVLSIDKKPLMRFAADGMDVSARDAAAFTRFMRYQFGGHPQVLDKVTAMNRIASHFVLFFREVGGIQTYSITISDLSASAPPSYDLARYAERVGGIDEIDQLLDRARHTQRPSMDETRARFDAEISAAFTEMRTLDALLGTSELVLMGAPPMAPCSPERLTMMHADTAAQAVIEAMNPSDEAGLKAAIGVMQSMHPQTTSKRHMLQLFEANDRAKLGQRANALELFAAVLRANPALAGAYKDLGDTLLADFDAPRAWRSWDEGRRIAPGLPLFIPVNEFEQKLLREHPEYF